jgi:hypothetical protein
MSQEQGSSLGPTSAVPLPWKKVFSRTHKIHYWFNETTGESKWEEPEECKVHGVSDVTITSAEELKASATESLRETSQSTASNKRKREDDVKVAIIVPFRDIHVEQKRSEHLRRFVPEMTK